MRVSGLRSHSGDINAETAARGGWGSVMGSRLVFPALYHALPEREAELSRGTWEEATVSLYSLNAGKNKRELLVNYLLKTGSNLKEQP